MYQVRVYLYDSNKTNSKGEDYSKYVKQGSEFTEDLTEVMDTAEITLTGLDKEECFTPGTKFLVEIYDSKEDIVYKTYHWCVKEDLVSQPILSDNNYYEHSITFIEPSVVAEHRIVDNIAITYKLKDVSLKEEAVYPKTTYNFSLDQTYESNYTFTPLAKPDQGDVTISFGKFFRIYDNERMKVLDEDGIEHNLVYENINQFAGQKLRLKLPEIRLCGGIKNQSENYFMLCGRVSIDYAIIESDFNEDSNKKTILSGSWISNDKIKGSENSLSCLNVIDNCWVLEKLEPRLAESYVSNKYYALDFYYKKYTNPNATEQSLYTEFITLQENKKYTISISLHNFTDSAPTIPYQAYINYGSKSYIYTESTFVKYQYLKCHLWVNDGSTARVDKIYTSDLKYLTIISKSNDFYTYSDGQEVTVYSSSKPYSALNLLEKAIMNSDVYFKKNGVYCTDVNNSDVPFYIDEEYIPELSTTQVIENFYNQKNLWEIMKEVGLYIHSVPELKFYNNDKFLITFNKLGRTDQKEDSGNRVSIYNTRAIDDYISSTSSYISNMVQIGGYIEEWVAPKTSDEQYLVYNDTASIIVSKPIIELLDVEVKCINKDESGIESGKIANMTDFIYESNVYKTLYVDPKYVPNRGIAMYYELGDKEIKGGQYQTPQANTNIYTDYAFKKIIWSAFNEYEYQTSLPTSGYWTNLKISNFVFKVKYRTKDSVRLTHSRPDIRKYLKWSNYDNYPVHYQFNSQEDITIDSIKYGQNIYGKLIKSGNNSYTINEWNNNIDSCKQKGELYNINGDLFYVSKVVNQILPDYVISKVTLSKDYNELSNIIGINSEPRFYEISEQSSITREVSINTFFMVSTNENKQNKKYILNADKVLDVIYGSNETFAKYVYLRFKGDKDNYYLANSRGFSDFSKTILLPVNCYSSGLTLTAEWDCVDNYSAGDKVIETSKDNYKSLQAVGYTDKYGKSELFDFILMKDLYDSNLTSKTIDNLPESNVEIEYVMPDYNSYTDELMEIASNTNYDEINEEDEHSYGLILTKDNRESISINFNIQAITDSDRFVLSPFFFEFGKSDIMIATLINEVNKLSNGYIRAQDIKSTYSFLDNHSYLVYLSDILEKADLTEIKAIALIYDYDVVNQKYKFIIARNVDGLTNDGKRQSWYLFETNKIS